MKNFGIACTLLQIFLLFVNLSSIAAQNDKCDGPVNECVADSIECSVTGDCCMETLWSNYKKLFRYEAMYSCILLGKWVYTETFNPFPNPKVQSDWLFGIRNRPVVTRCPIDFTTSVGAYKNPPSDNLKRKCENPNATRSDEQQYAVEWMFRKIFRNKYCAECHGFSANQIILIPLTKYCSMEVKTKIISLEADPNKMYNAFATECFQMLNDKYIDVGMTEVGLNPSQSNNSKVAECTRDGDPINKNFDLLTIDEITALTSNLVPAEWACRNLKGYTPVGDPLCNGGEDCTIDSSYGSIVRCCFQNPDFENRFQMENLDSSFLNVIDTSIFSPEPVFLSLGQLSTIKSADCTLSHYKEAIICKESACKSTEFGYAGMCTAQKDTLVFQFEISSVQHANLSLICQLTIWNTNTELIDACQQLTSAPDLITGVSLSTVDATREKINSISKSRIHFRISNVTLDMSTAILEEDFKTMLSDLIDLKVTVNGNTKKGPGCSHIRLIWTAVHNTWLKFDMCSHSCLSTVYHMFREPLSMGSLSLRNGWQIYSNKLIQEICHPPLYRSTSSATLLQYQNVVNQWLLIVLFVKTIL